MYQTGDEVYLICNGVGEQSMVIYWMRKGNKFHGVSDDWRDNKVIFQFLIMLQVHIQLGINL